MEMQFARQIRALNDQHDFPLSYRRAPAVGRKTWNWGLIVSVALSSMFWVGLTLFVIAELRPHG